MKPLPDVHQLVESCGGDRKKAAVVWYDGWLDRQEYLRRLNRPWPREAAPPKSKPQQERITVVLHIHSDKQPWWEKSLDKPNEKKGISL